MMFLKNIMRTSGSKKIIFLGFILLSAMNHISSLQAANDRKAASDKKPAVISSVSSGNYRSWEIAEMVAAIAKLPCNIASRYDLEKTTVKGTALHILKATARAVHAGIAIHNKPNDRQFHNNFWLGYSIGNIIADLIHVTSLVKEDDEAEISQLLQETQNNQKPEAAQELTIEASEDMKNRVAEFLRKARTLILPAIESGLGVYCAVNNGNSPVDKKKRIRAQAICSIVIALSEYLDFPCKGVEADIQAAIVILSVLKACDDFFIYDPVEEHAREVRRIAEEKKRKAAKNAKKPPRAILVEEDDGKNIEIHRGSRRALSINAECPICLEDFEDNQRITIFGCNHVLHVACRHNFDGGGGAWAANAHMCMTCRQPRNRAVERDVSIRGNDDSDGDAGDESDDDDDSGDDDSGDDDGHGVGAGGGEPDAGPAGHGPAVGPNPARSVAFRFGHRPSVRFSFRMPPPQRATVRRDGARYFWLAR